MVWDVRRDQSFYTELMTREPQYRPFAIPGSHPVAKELAASWKLFEQLRKEFNTPMGTGQFDKIILLLFARIWRLYRAVLTLVVDGFGPEAESHVRSMAEANAACWWAISHHDLAVERFQQNVAYVLRLRQPDDIAPLTEEAETAARQLFGKYGEKSWTGCGEDQLGRELNDFLEAGGARGLEPYRSPLRQWQNWTIHNSPLTLFKNQVILSDPLMISIAPTEVSLLDAIQAAHSQVVVSVCLALLYWDSPLSAAMKNQLFDSWCAFVPAARNAGRNEPCPCGSEIKFKNCHMP